MKDLCESKAKQAVAKAAGYAREEEVEVALFQQEQRKKMLGRASATTKLKGRADDERRSFVQANLVAEAASPPRDGPKVPSLKARARATGLPLRTAERALKV